MQYTRQILPSFLAILITGALSFMARASVDVRALGALVVVFLVVRARLVGRGAARLDGGTPHGPPQLPG